MLEFVGGIPVSTATSDLLDSSAGEVALESRRSELQHVVPRLCISRSDQENEAG
jgi:hypothetical protein